MNYKLANICSIFIDFYIYIEIYLKIDIVYYANFIIEKIDVQETIKLTSGILVMITITSLILEIFEIDEDNLYKQMS